MNADTQHINSIALNPVITSDSTVVFTYIAAVIAGFVLLALVAALVRNPEDGNDKLNGYSDIAIGWAMLMLMLWSLYMSTQFGKTIYAQAPAFGAGFFFIMAVIQCALSLRMKGFIVAGNYASGLMCLFGLVICLGLSFMASQGTISGEKQAERIVRTVQSDEYQTALQARQNAARRAESMAVSDKQYETAKAERKRLQAELSVYLANTALNGRGESAGTVSTAISRYGCSGHYSSYCADRDRIQGEIDDTWRIIERYQAYSGLKAHADSLQAEALPTPASAGNPHFEFLHRLTGFSHEAIEAYGFTVLCIIIDLTAVALGFLFANALTNMTETRKSASEELIPAGVDRSKVPGLGTGGYITSDGYAFVHEGERVLNIEETIFYEDYLKLLEQGEYVDTRQAREKPIKKAPGATVGTADVDTVAVNTDNRNNTEQRHATDARISTEKRNTDGWKARGFSVGDWFPCDNPKCDSGFEIVKGEHPSKRFCTTNCRAQGNGFNDEEHVKKAVSRKRRKQQ